MPTSEPAPIILVAIDDDPTSLDLIAATVDEPGLEVVTARDPVQGLALVKGRRPQIVVCDLMMPGMTGMEVLSEIVAFDPMTEVILLTAHYSTETAVEAIQKGACDYFNKPISTEKLRARIHSLVEQARRRSLVKRLDAEMLQAHRDRGIIGRSPIMLELFARVERIAPHYRTVLITRADGSGPRGGSSSATRDQPGCIRPFRCRELRCHP